MMSVMTVGIYDIMVTYIEDGVPNLLWKAKEDRWFVDGDA